MSRKVIKKDNTLEDFNEAKIITAINKSAERVGVKLNDDVISLILKCVKDYLSDKKMLKVYELHGIVEKSLDKVIPEVAKSYKDYRNYKKENSSVLEDISKQVTFILYEVDRENSNQNSRLISTKRTLVSQKMSKELYQKYYMSVPEKQAIKDGFFYVHDLADRLLGMINCCLFRLGHILKGGFWMSNTFYTEAKDIRTAIGQAGDVIMCASAQQYGLK